VGIEAVLRKALNFKDLLGTIRSLIETSERARCARSRERELQPLLLIGAWPG